MNIPDSLLYLNRMLHERPGTAFVNLAGRMPDKGALAIALSQPPKLLEVPAPRPRMMPAEDIGTTYRWLKHPGDPDHLLHSHASQTPQKGSQQTGQEETRPKTRSA